MRMKQILLMAVAGAGMLGLSACEKHLKAPTDEGVCYFIGHPKKDEVKFNVVARDVPDIEHCAVQLYVVRRGMVATGTAGKETQGAYQGSFLFVSDKKVDFGKTYEGAVFPLLVKSGNSLVQPGSIVFEDELPKEQETVTVPKNLPEKDSTGVVVTQKPADQPPAPKP